MRIAQVAPLYESVPPRGYGGTERIVYYLTEELVRMGHQVTLFASGDSQTSAELVPICKSSLRTSSPCIDPLAHHMLMLDRVVELAPRFDVIHFHVDYLHFPVSRAIGLPQLTTLHGRLDLPDLAAVYERFVEMPVVSISNAQRAPIPNAGWLGTVLHGLPEHALSFCPVASDYFAFVGRISPEKRVDRAAEIATTLGVPLRVGAKIDRVDREYYEREIAYWFEHPLIHYVGEISEQQKESFIGSARALLFPIDWPEPFGLVMIEAMACGTPVIAFDHGSVREVVEDGVSGFIVRDMPSAIEAARHVGELPRAGVRAAFERRFTARRMARDYVELYQTLSERCLQAALGASATRNRWASPTVSEAMTSDRRQSASPEPSNGVGATITALPKANSWPIPSDLEEHGSQHRHKPRPEM